MEAIQLSARPVANPLLVLREEFDDWAILFDPDTGEGHGLNPVAVYVYKRLDGRHSLQEILSALRSECEDVPVEAEKDVCEFIGELAQKGYVGYEANAG